MRRTRERSADQGSQAALNELVVMRQLSSKSGRDWHSEIAFQISVGVGVMLVRHKTR